MYYARTDELERLVNKLVATGQYASVADVVAAALRLLEAMERESAAIYEGKQNRLAVRPQPLEPKQSELRYEFPFLNQK